jgi:hypothetical protein
MLSSVLLCSLIPRIAVLGFVTHSIVQAALQSQHITVYKPTLV